MFLLSLLQALRAAFDRYFDTSFEVVLREAEAAVHSSTSSSSGSWGSVTYGRAAATTAGADDGAGGSAPGGTRTVLLRRPAVFTLAVVWESPKVGNTAGSDHCVESNCMGALLSCSCNTSASWEAPDSVLLVDWGGQISCLGDHEC